MLISADIMFARLTNQTFQVQTPSTVRDMHGKKPLIKTVTN